ncbi:MAG: hypothetical protein ACFFD7_14005, partial [Candidatus Thorarchaeota archaeon]
CRIFVISEDLIKMIVESTYNNGDIRFGLNILWKAAKIAENRNLTFIDNECVRLGSQELVPFSTLDVLRYMSSQKLFFLLAIVKGLKNSSQTEIFLAEITKRYHIICENLGLNPRSNSQIWNYLQDFKREGIITVKILSEKIKGRRALIQIPEINLQKLEKIIVELLKVKRIKV